MNTKLRCVSCFCLLHFVIFSKPCCYRLSGNNNIPDDNPEAMIVFQSCILYILRFAIKKWNLYKPISVKNALELMLKERKSYRQKIKK